ncbi:hypothetical protein PF005_g15762 [Phytophthora fragariae]|uniref:Uncharacterized protein n=2 Tax=Phytophthora TaxID=4783 RepID=A0A6A3SY30_9STRA|nr:hypothetical protein PF003_g9391 [Phytophthora fragariae]KAE9009578.1 hypothetical protein PR002_g15579 [Phytophthora rubi]KAE8943842.1 hypothetical protein PF009_g6425 [Phytophthora fragariae]KAE8997793.1 hypothetical protein PF011_g15318 [Phytophthora fragariae]KAE9014677.1 hypothetical protein PR001_g15082 [Phytophthora rubi]
MAGKLAAGSLRPVSVSVCTALVDCLTQIASDVRASRNLRLDFNKFRDDAVDSLIFCMKHEIRYTYCIPNDEARGVVQRPSWICNWHWPVLLTCVIYSTAQYLCVASCCM